VSRSAKAVPFDGTPPPVKPGELVQIRSAYGEWTWATAKSEPRYDFDRAIGRRCHLTVSVAHPDYEHPVNWPAEDVRPGSGEEPEHG
jgi:hypothetical protein